MFHVELGIINCVLGTVFSECESSFSALEIVVWPKNDQIDIWAMKTEQRQWDVVESSGKSKQSDLESGFFFSSNVEDQKWKKGNPPTVHP